MFNTSLFTQKPTLAKASPVNSYLLPALTIGFLAVSTGGAQAISIKFDDFTQNFNGSNDLISTIPTGAGNRPGNGPLATNTLNYNLDGLQIERFATVRSTTTNTNLTQLRRSFLSATNEIGRFDNSSQTTGVATLKYSFAAPVDLTIGGNNGLRLAYYGSGLGLSIKVSDGTNTATFNGAFTDNNGSEFANFDVKFGNSAFAGINFQNISYVEYTLNQSIVDKDTDFSFIGATAVPEPVTILGTLLAGGIGVALKKKKDSSAESC